MKDQADTQTVEIFEVKRRRGRPRTGSALSSAERQKRYRERKNEVEEGASRVEVFLNNVEVRWLDQLCEGEGLSRSQMVTKLIDEAYLRRNVSE